MKEIAQVKVVLNSRITIPPVVREMLNLGIGDNVLFFKSENGVLIKKGMIVEVPAAGC